MPFPIKIRIEVRGDGGERSVPHGQEPGAEARLSCGALRGAEAPLFHVAARFRGPSKFRRESESKATAKSKATEGVSVPHGTCGVGKAKVPRGARDDKAFWWAGDFFLGEFDSVGFAQ